MSTNSTSEGLINPNSFTSPLVDSFTTSSLSSNPGFINSFTNNSSAETTLSGHGFTSPSSTASSSSSPSFSTTVPTSSPNSPLPSSSPSFPSPSPPSETKLNRTVSDGESDVWPCPSCTFLNSNLMRVCEMCTAPRPGVADDDKMNKPDHFYSDSGGGGGSVSSSSSNHPAVYGGGEDPIHKFIFFKNPYPEHQAIEFTKGEQADVWIEGMGWCVGTMVKLETDRVCFHVSNHGGVWKDKNTDHLAPLNTQTHYYDHFLKRLDGGSDPSKALVPYVPSATLSSHSVSSTTSSSTPFVTTTTTTPTTTTTSTNPKDSGSYVTTLGLVPESPEKEIPAEKTESPIVTKKEKKINVDTELPSPTSISTFTSTSLTSNSASPASASLSTSASPSSINESISTTTQNGTGNNNGMKDNNISQSISAPSVTSTSSSGSGSTQSEEETGMWECLGCTYRNLARAGNCVVCTTIRYQDEA